MGYTDIIFEVKDKIAYITFNRPNVLNALSKAMKEELDQALDLINRDEEIWGVIITGSGRAFCAGADLSEVKMTPVQRLTMSEDTHRLFDKLQDVVKPVIAAVNGYALGGGCEIALACDLRIASAKAAFGVPETSLGVFPAFGGSQRLPRLVGVGMAKEMIFTARQVKAAEAKEIGLVNKVVEPDGLMNEAEAMMKLILEKGPVAVRIAKQLVNRGMFDMGLHGGLAFERIATIAVASTEDNEEGVNAFLEKRKPVFKNR